MNCYVYIHTYVYIYIYLCVCPTGIVYSSYTLIFSPCKVLGMLKRAVACRVLVQPLHWLLLRGQKSQWTLKNGAHPGAIVSKRGI